MAFDRWPFEPNSAAALVAQMIIAIDNSSDGDRDDLLDDLLRAAWPSLCAQDH